MMKTLLFCMVLSLTGDFLGVTHVRAQSTATLGGNGAGP
jgi:hypothetical protein